jgi:hypothetical protein
MLWYKKLVFKRKVKVLLAALMYPASTTNTGVVFKREIIACLEQASSRNWTPEMAAGIIATAYLRNFIGENFSADEKASYADQIKNTCPKDLVSELQWLQILENDKAPDMDDPFIFRYTFISAILASWLVKDQTIDIYTKSLFATIPTQALLSVDSKKIDAKFQEMLVQIGPQTQPKPKAA